jgi:hypothetical protein
MGAAGQREVGGVRRVVGHARDVRLCLAHILRAATADTEHTVVCSSLEVVQPWQLG